MVMGEASGFDTGPAGACAATEMFNKKTRRAYVINFGMIPKMVLAPNHSSLRRVSQSGNTRKHANHRNPVNWMFLTLLNANSKRSREAMAINLHHDVQVLPVRHGPHWEILEYCRHIGIAKTYEDHGHWVARIRTKTGKYKQKRFTLAVALRNSRE